ncbi:MAG: hypothetical protein PVH88_23990 [Ignavibacteria bacterium]|jgi:hypothetical protein
MNLTKRISKTVLVTAALTLVNCNISAQSTLFNHKDFFNTLFQQKYKINSYYLGSNPAYLNQEVSDERLLVETSFDNRHGDFKSFVMPGDESEMQLSFSGKKRISEKEIFKGSTGFSREIRNNWNWIVNKNYERTNTFLYGDSTSGTSHYHSIYLNAQYSAEVVNSFNLGASLDYAVDEGLKEVSPKPESEHRDIYVNVGLGYEIDDNNSFGFSVKYRDFNEKIYYSEDEGAVYDETIIFKFTGYDYPSIYYKKVEERRTYTSAYYAALTFQHKSDLLSAAASFSMGFDKQVIKDGGTDPISKGFSKNNSLIGEAAILYKLTGSLYTSLKYQYSYTDYWARHPDYNVLIMEEETPSHFVNLGAEYALDNSLSLGLEGGIRLHSYDMDEYYSGVTAGFEGKEYIAKIGVDYLWSEVFSTTLGIAYNKNSLSDKVLICRKAGNFFENFRKYDLLYKLTPYTSYAGYLKTSFNIQNIGEIGLNIIYSQTDPEDEVVFKGFNRKNINAFLQFRRQVY